MNTVLIILLITSIAAYTLGRFYQYQLVSHKTINADIDVVWKQLTEFESYESWNPFITSIKGQAIKGSQLRALIAPPGAKPMTFKPKILKVEKNRELRWLGTFLVPGLFDGEHYFKLTKNKDGSTELTHGETFSGLLAWIMMPNIKGSTLAGFEAMNNALAQCVKRKKAF